MKNKLNLEKLKVKSFNTSEIKGGNDEPGTTHETRTFWYSDCTMCMQTRNPCDTEYPKGGCNTIP